MKTKDFLVKFKAIISQGKDAKALFKRISKRVVTVIKEKGESFLVLNDEFRR